MTAEAKFWRLAALTAFAALFFLVMLQLWPRLTAGFGAPRDLPPIGYEVVSFADLPDWDTEDFAGTVEVFLRSCATLSDRDGSAAMNAREALGLESETTLAGHVEDWRAPCDAAALLPVSASAQEKRTFFETFFHPVQVKQPDGDGRKLSATGLFTGYFEPAYSAAREQIAQFSVPVLSRPADLVMVDLGAFREGLAGTRIAGRVADGRLLPYADHASIVESGLDTDILAWMDPNDLLFLQIQGSGRLLLPDGEALRVGYDGQNGHPYTAIGGPLIRRGEIAREDMSMQAIRDWLSAAPPQEAAALRHLNASYVFFRILDNLPDPALGPLGAQGVQLTDMRSIALDRRFHAMGVPVFVAIEGDEEHAVLNRLMIAQDTGGAIRGPVRGDLYIGSGEEAGKIAGGFNREGALFVLLPTELAERLTR